MKNVWKQMEDLLLGLYQSRRLITQLIVQDIKSRYLGSYLGLLWAFVQPTITIFIFWFVFEVGFRSSPIGNFPFILWLITGMVPWFFVSDSISGATESIIQNSFLVNKVVFRVSLLPLIRVLSSLVVHLFFIAITIGMFYAYSYQPTVYYLQLVYYLGASLILVTGIGWITSSLVIFIKDMQHLVAMLLQFGFWLTPIFWPIHSIPEQYQPLIRLNPFCYIIEGYRATFIRQQWFWEDSGAAIGFWITALMIFTVGALLFRRLRPHFADVL